MVYIAAAMDKNTSRHMRDTFQFIKFFKCCADAVSPRRDCQPAYCCRTCVLRSIRGNAEM